MWKLLIISNGCNMLEAGLVFACRVITWAAWTFHFVKNPATFEWSRWSGAGGDAGVSFGLWPDRCPYLSSLFGSLGLFGNSKVFNLLIILCHCPSLSTINDFVVGNCFCHSFTIRYCWEGPRWYCEVCSLVPLLRGLADTARFVQPQVFVRFGPKGS